jgi:excisionase family DNA binding protein
LPSFDPWEATLRSRKLSEQPETVTAGISKFAKIADVSRPTIYRMLAAGDLKSIKIGSKRLILLDSYRDLIARRVTEEPR